MLAATACLGLGTLLVGQTRADDTTGNNAGGQAGISQPGQSAVGGQQGANGEINGASQQADETANNAGGGQGIRQELMAANDPDKLFVVMCAVNEQSQYQLAKLAENKAQDQQVKQLAQRIIQDHQQADQSLQQAAQNLSIQLPKGLPMTTQQEKKVFQSLNGKQFDQQYVSQLRACQAAAISMLTDEAQLAQNEQVKQFASQQLPILQSQSQDTQKSAVALGLPSSNEAQTAGAQINGSQSQQNQNSPNGQNNQNNQGQSNPSATPQGTGTGQNNGQ